MSIKPSPCQKALFAPPVTPPGPSTATLYLGDCLEVMPRLEAGSVDMVFADLPYSCTQNKWDIPIDLDAFWKSMKCVLADRCPSILTATQPFTTHLIASNLKNFRYDLVWQKTNITGFFMARRAPLRDHETLLYFSEKLGTYNAQSTPVGPTNVYRPNTIYGTTSRSSNYGGRGKQPHRPDCGQRLPRSVLRIASEARQKSLHPTQKPVALLEYLIKTFTNPGDTVLDPCFGSCTTGVACARLGRNFIGIERDKTYFKVGRERLAAERKRLGLT